MNIAVLSGKGGTGKTFVSVNLAAVANNSTYIDCDIEEPNGYLFLKPKNLEIDSVKVKIPIVNKDICIGCRKCVEFCKFNALAYINNNLMVFDDICHSCGGCKLVCPQGAISEEEKIIGEVQKGTSENINVITGILNTGEVSGTPIIKEALNNIEKNKGLTIIDSPPGSACTVMDSIKDADYCILVAEPTVFGVHNLNMVYELLELFQKPYGVVLNKCTEEENPAEEFCKEKGIKVLEKISFSNKLGELNSNAKIVTRESKKYEKLFSSLLQKIVEEVQNETTINS